ncbi:MAG: dynamin family protein [Firmicutes bacterium]|nr:dynamin family protein [Bacillota bacterium]
MKSHTPGWMRIVSDVVAQSPVRRLIQDGRPAPEPDLIESLKKIPRQLQALEEHLAKPLRLAVLGEVKSGKSTLVNALVGEDVAPVDVLEATRWIMEIRHGSTASARLTMSDGKVQEGTPEEIARLLHERRTDEDFVARCEHVAVTLPLPSLSRLHLVDTPGLATVTESAAERTRRYLQEVDAVLWVLNANHLGQTDVVEALADVARTGKPVIAIVNRIDEVDAEPARLEEYVQAQLAEYVQAVFATSAFAARSGQRTQNPALIDQSGLGRLMQYVYDNFELQADDAQLESVRWQALSLIHSDRSLHEQYADRVLFLADEADNFVRQLELEADRIRNEVEIHIWNELNRYTQSVSYRLDQEAIPRKVWDRVRATVDATSYETELRQKLEEAFRGHDWQSFVDDLDKSVHARLKSEWESVANRVGASVDQRFQTLHEQNAERRHNAARPSSVENDFLQELRDTLFTGTVIGGAVAGYSAATGVAAATTFVPPVLIAILAAAVLRTIAKSSETSRNLGAFLRDSIKEARQGIERRWIRPTVLPAVDAFNREVMKSLTTAFSRRTCQGWSAAGLKQLYREIDRYLLQLDQVRDEIRKGYSAYPSQPLAG